MPATKTHRTAEHPTEGFRLAFLPTMLHRPACIYLPTDYQPLYAYPLVVLFHANGQSEDHTARLVPLLSRRNYVVVCLRGPVQLGLHSDGRPCFGWASIESAKRDLELTLRHATTQYSVHPDRVFLGGAGEGATLALQLGLAYRDRVAGVVALNGQLVKGRIPANELRVFLAHGIANPVVPFAEARRAAARLSAAGAVVRVHRFATSNRIHPDMLRDANRWIMTQVTGKSEGE
ncbi:MAG: hypothetical protein L0241_04670 [Planctomycetia bacterium]|nr:hypothetical protein [Planctomycetia bacterium]